MRWLFWKNKLAIDDKIAQYWFLNSTPGQNYEIMYGGIIFFSKF